MTLRSIPKIPKASWSSWNAREYLDTYFHTLGTDSIAAWRFLVSELKYYQTIPNKVLDFGAGPTVFGAIPLSKYKTEIHVADYLENNLKEIRKWLKGDKDAFDWSKCVEEVIRIEGGIPNKRGTSDRMLLLKNQITKLIPCDASKDLPLGKNTQYPLVISTYCADSATNSKDTWRLYMRNILSLVTPSGHLLLTALRNCKSYKVGGIEFPSANINEKDLQEVLLQNGFNKENIQIEICDAFDCEDEGFTGLVFVSATKS